MTEDEAKTKWCPFSAGGKKVERGATFIRSPNCIGSACMAWRWSAVPREPHGSPYIQAIKDHRSEHGSSLADAKKAVDATWVRPSHEHGYCGLAGASQ